MAGIRSLRIKNITFVIKLILILSDSKIICESFIVVRNEIKTYISN